MDRVLATDVGILTVSDHAMRMHRLLLPRVLGTRGVRLSKGERPWP